MRLNASTYLNCPADDRTTAMEVIFNKALGKIAQRASRATATDPRRMMDTHSVATCFGKWSTLYCSRRQVAVVARKSPSWQCVSTPKKSFLSGSYVQQCWKLPSAFHKRYQLKDVISQGMQYVL